MAIQVFRLRNVPDDEAEEIRQLLTEHHIDFYETPAGNWGISMPALWLKDEAQLDRAKALIARYQQQRLQQAQENAALIKPWQAWWAVFRQDPGRFIIYMGLIGIIVYFSLMPFFGLT